MLKKIKKRKDWTIKQFITYFMVFIIIFQAVLFALIMAIGGGLRNLADNSFKPFKETVDLRVEDFTAQLNSAANELTEKSPAIKDNLQKVANKYGAPLSQLQDNQNAKVEMYQRNMDNLRTLATKDNISGAFLIMDTRMDNYTPVSAVVLRKTDMGTENVNAPTTLLVGGDYLVKEGVTHKSIYWSQCLNMDYPEDYDFYAKTLEIAKENKNIPGEKLGYWSDTYDINDGKRRMMAYTLPIVDSENTVVGVMGVEMDLNYLQLLLPYYELNSQGVGDYVAVRMESFDAETGKRIFVSGNTFNEMNKYSDEVEYSAKPKADGVYQMMAKGKTSSKVYATKNILDIYGNAAYSYSPIILSGMVESRYLLEYVNKIQMNIVLGFAIMMILSLIFVFNFTDRMVAPINSFVSTIKKIRPDNIVRPDPTRIREINEMGTSIADVTEELSSFSRKTSAILSLTGVSIAAFEYDPASNYVFVTEDTFKIFGMYKQNNVLYMDKKMFESRIVPIIKNIRPGIDVVAPVKSGKTTKWLHIKTVEEEGKILGTIRDVTEETLAGQQKDYERDHDPLTGFLNRQPFIDKMREHFSTGKGLALLAVCKIPDLSAINSRYGSIVGDKYLKSVADVFWTLDEPTTKIARTMGDEFTMYIDGMNANDITEKFNRLLEKLNTTEFNDGDINVPHNIFAGVAWYPANTKNADELVAYAEFAASGVENFTGRNLVQVFSDEAYQTTLAKHKNQDLIGHLLETGSIRYAYQPIIDTATGDIYGYEALMRPQADGITPGDVMQYASRNDAFYAVERTTWINALKGFTEQVDSLSPKRIFVNSIPNQLLVDEDIALIEELYGGYLDNVVLEILENEQTDAGFVEKKRALKDKWQCLLALDDFGSGYANENSLLTIKPDLIKLDLDLVANIDEDADRQSLVKNIVGYAHNRNIKVLAEGIESREQMNILLSLQVDLLQGFYLAKPNETVLEELDPKIKEQITSFDPNDMFSANVALRM
ncbi:MAG: EAL domain-containing protein [Firmicutes bacterium]|nr:EAL domain-containing protein [Bacillota bacterium]